MLDLSILVDISYSLDILKKGHMAPRGSWDQTLKTVKMGAARAYGHTHESVAMECPIP